KRRGHFYFGEKGTFLLWVDSVKCKESNQNHQHQNRRNDLHTSHFTLHTSHFTLHTSHFTLHNLCNALDLSFGHFREDRQGQAALSNRLAMAQGTGAAVAGKRRLAMQRRRVVDGAGNVGLAQGGLERLAASFRNQNGKLVVDVLPETILEGQLDPARSEEHTSEL